MDLRRYARYVVDFPIYLFTEGFADTTPIGSGRVFNLCEHGCKVTSDTPVSMGDQLAVRLYDPHLSPPVQVHSTIVIWAMGHDLGLEFLTMQQGERERLRQYIQTLERNTYHQPEPTQW